MKKLALITTALLTLTVGSAFAEGDTAPTMEKKGGEKGMQQRLDTNGDGVVSKSEFLAHAEERFGKIDKDGSGDITKDEGREAHKQMRERKKEYMGKKKERREQKQSEAVSE